MSSTNLRRVGIASAATTMVLGACIAGAGSASAEARFGFERVAGDNRYATAAQAAAKFGTADTVILASGEPGRYADALTASYLAGKKDAPVLLTRKDQAPEEAKTAIRDLGAENIIIVGGTGVVSQEQEDSLDGTYNVSRLAGDDRFGTAAAVIAEGDEAAGDTALLATGLDFPDALGGGPVAYAKGMPLAITRPNDAPDNVVRELKQAGIKKVLVLGGKSAVGDAVVKELDDNGITVAETFAGDDRAETSALLANYALKNLQMTKDAVNVASGYVKGSGADALGGAALSGKQNRTLLITKTENAPGQAVLEFLTPAKETEGEVEKNLTKGTIFGGTGAVSQSAEDQMVKAVLGSGAQNARTGEFYDDVQAAITEAEKGDTINVFGKDLAGFRVNKPDLTIKGDEASLKEAIVVQGVDGVTISGFTITPSNVGGQMAGIYLNDAEDVVISGNTVLGSGQGAASGAGVINEIGGGDEVADLHHNLFRDLQQGIYANPTAEFTITSNEFRNNTAGSANDAASVIKDNEFVNNDEGIGLSVKGAEVTGNSFANNKDAHVGDYSPDSAYDLAAMIKVNTFDEEVVVDPATDGPGPEFIKDKS